jgi:signal transduction histidine kinase
MSEMESRPHWTLVVLVAVALSVLAMLVALVVRLSVHQTPYFLFLPAVMIASWYGGRIGGLVATMTCVLLLDYYVLEPQYSLMARTVQDAAVLALFGLVSTSVALLTASRREAVVEREAALREAQEARQHAETSSRLKDQFLATLSHELRTPLNAVLGWTSVLISGRLEPDKVPAALATIQRNAQAQKQLVDDLLDTSAIVSGRLRLEPAPIDLAEVAQSAVDAVRLSFEARNQRLVSRLESVWTVGDATRLRQVIWNLLSNAVKFTPEGGSIELLLTAQDGEARIVVRDNGRGIAADFLPHVFDPFRQADSSITRVSGGLGLGLALVRHLAEAHGGRVWVESEGPGRGAVFTTCLPIREPAGPFEQKVRRAEAPATAADTEAPAVDAEPISVALSSASNTVSADGQPCDPPPGAVTPASLADPLAASPASATRGAVS